MPVVVITPDNEVQIVPDPVVLDLAFLQKEVEGWIENVEIAVSAGKKELILQMWVNEEGLLKRLPYNPVATYLYALDRGPGGVIVGNVVITGLKDADTATLSEEEFSALIDEIMEYSRDIAKWESSFTGFGPIDISNK
jgi:hypothetical protein